MRGRNPVENFQTQYDRLKTEKIHELQQKTKADQKDGADKLMDQGKDGDGKLDADGESNSHSITRQQEQQIENEVLRKIKRERGVEGGGVKIVREKVPFIW